MLRSAKMRNSGQTCISPNRMLVQRSMLDEFLEELVGQVSEHVRAGYSVVDRTTSLVLVSLFFVCVCFIYCCAIRVP